MVLEKYREQIYNCQRCSWCKHFVDIYKGIDGICAVREYHPMGTWDFNFARGQVQIARGILEKKFKITPDLINILFDACTTCGSCTEHCIIYMGWRGFNKNIGFKPYLDPTEVIEALRAEIVEQGLAPLKPHKKIAQNLKDPNIFNAWGGQRKERWNWMPADIQPDPKSEILFYAGCTSPYKVPEIVTSAVKVLNAGGVKFNTMGDDEWDCGSTLFRTGQWDLAKECMEYNLKKWKELGIKTIVTHCAGCYRTFYKDYPKWSGDAKEFEILHLSQYIKKLMDEGKLKIKRKVKNVKVTYQDPCHLGRHCGVFDPPREVLKAIYPNFVEMFPTREHAFCCGAAGGMKTYDNKLAVKMGTGQIEKGRATQAEILVSTCPFCLENLRDANNKLSHPFKEVVDLANIVERAI